MPSTRDTQQAKFEELAKKHRVGEDAVQTLARAMESGHERMAQFSHPDLGGMASGRRAA